MKFKKRTSLICAVTAFCLVFSACRMNKKPVAVSSDTVAMGSVVSITSYTYDENNRVIGVTKPDGSVTTTVYDNMQRVTSTVERTADGGVITGFEYTYDDLSRIVEEKVLADSIKMR